MFLVLGPASNGTHSNWHANSNNDNNNTNNIGDNNNYNGHNNNKNNGTFNGNCNGNASTKRSYMNGQGFVHGTGTSNRASNGIYEGLPRNGGKECHYGTLGIYRTYMNI